MLILKHITASSSLERISLTAIERILLTAVERISLAALERLSLAALERISLTPLEKISLTTRLTRLSDAIDVCLNSYSSRVYESFLSLAFCLILSFLSAKTSSHDSP